MSGSYRGTKPYWCVSCKKAVPRKDKLWHTGRGHSLVGRPRRRLAMNGG